MAGTVLRVPNKVTNVHNTSETYRPYDPGKALGNTSPTLPEPPPPPGRGGCGGLGQVLSIVVAVAVTVWTGGAAAAFLNSQIVGWAIGGAVGSIAGQAVGMATGVQDKFSWAGVALGAVGSGVTAGLAQAANLSTTLVQKFGETGSQVALGAMRSVATQGIGVVTGLQSSFDWKGVATSAIAGGVAYQVGTSSIGKLEHIGDIAQGFSASVSSALVRGGSLSRNMGAIVGDAIGATIGNRIAKTLGQPESTAVTLNGIRVGEEPAGVRLPTQYLEPTGGKPGGSESLASAERAQGFGYLAGVGTDVELSGLIGVHAGDLLAANTASGRNSSTGMRLPAIPAALYALRDPAVLADPDALGKLHGVALQNSRAWLPSSLSPVETSLTTGVAYQKLFGDDRTAVWFGLAPYATSKVGETYQLLDRAGLSGSVDAGVIRAGFSEGNRAIFESMFTAEQFYQAGGTAAIRAMVTLDNESFGARWTQENYGYETSVVRSFELRDEAKAAFAAGQIGKGEELLGQSLRASADFEQRVVLQQYYDKSYAAIGEIKTLRQSIQDLFRVGTPPRIAEVTGSVGAKLVETGRNVYNTGVDAIARQASTVTIHGKSLSFTGNDVGDVSQRMPFVYGLADNLMGVYTQSGNWLSGSGRIYQDQFNVLNRVYGYDAVSNVRRRLGL